MQSLELLDFVAENTECGSKPFLSVWPTRLFTLPNPALSEAGIRDAL